jgi:hypothetical protein
MARIVTKELSNVNAVEVEGLWIRKKRQHRPKETDQDARPLPDAQLTVAAPPPAPVSRKYEE